MILGFLIPVVLILAGMALVWRYYRKRMSDLTTGSPDRPLQGSRLTAERLRGLSNPPWRVVHYIGDQLGAIDHVVIGPGGVIAIQTILSDRPDLSGGSSTDPERIAAAAIARGAVDDITRPLGVPCNLEARVYWGVAQPDLPASLGITHGQVAVEGQRLEQWLIGLPPGTLGSTHVDQLWQAVVMGIGRPDPLA